MNADELELMLAPIRALPFVETVEVYRGRGEEFAAEIMIKAPAGSAPFTIEVKKNYLDRPALAAFFAAARRLEREGRPPLLLLARYVPRVAGKQLVRWGIYFADQAGNVNLRIGERYHALVLGNRDMGRAERARRLSPGAVQMLFVALARPELLRAPVRKLAEHSGVSKSTAAETRRQLLLERLVVLRSSGDYQIADQKAIRERFLLGYSQVLRPHLLLGRYRGPYESGSAFVEMLARACARRSAPWALTGGAGAYQLDRYYRGEQTAAYVGAWSADFAKQLRLAPDSAGPIVLLRPFGDLVVWSHQMETPIAHPWLIYAELLHDGDPRAIEAAEELRRNHLS